jgi:hypothetical protein
MPTPPNPRSSLRRRTHLLAIAASAAFVATLTALAILVMLAAAASAHASFYSTWRCGSRLVATGDSASRVLSRCGNPAYVQTSAELVTFRLVSGIEVSRLVSVETWTYDRGSRELLRYLVFRDGRLIRIATGTYGG